MLTQTTTATRTGLKPTTIRVEVDLIRGKPQLIIIGLASQAVSESKERITATLLSVDIIPKSKRTIVNLAPADIKKTGSGFDLPIIVAMLQAYKKIQFSTNNTMFFGELSLGGDIKKITGILPLILHAKKAGFKSVVIPQENQTEVSLIDDINIYPIKHISQLLNINCLEQLPLLQNNMSTKQPVQKFTNNFEDIYGQEEAKHALEIAAAGGHNILLTGTPGTGKNMLAQAFVSILPPLHKKEVMSVNSIYSIAGLLKESILLYRPFRSPHHSISSAGMLGGGTNLTPGEISLAHCGVLFLDEIPEFPKHIIESLRQPLESGKIIISRISGSITYPCEFTLVAASNPCPCGYKFSEFKTCICTQNQYLNYKKRLSGPILDRIDLKVYVQPVATKKILLNSINENETSLTIKKRVIKARKIQEERYKNETILTNNQLTTKLIRKYCTLTNKAEQLLKSANQRYQFSTRTYFRLIKVAQTIADLDTRTKIETQDIAQALQYSKEREN